MDKNDFVIPVLPSQLLQLTQELDTSAKPVRFLVNGRTCCISTGYLCSKGSNVIYHPVYWDRPKRFIDQVVKFLKENNPNDNITVR